MPHYKNPVSVLVVLYTSQLDILLLERAAHPGYWQSVTGSQEEGETLRQTARREVLEETGIAAPLSAFEDWHWSSCYEIFEEWRHRYAPGITHNTEHVFSLLLPAVQSVKLAPEEHRAARWLPYAEAAACCFSPSNRDAILALPRRGAGLQSSSKAAPA